MEWVETTGRTVDEAKDTALDQLGIDESEAEFEVLDEAKTGLFGRVRADARVRARVAPRAPRPKQERRTRKQRPKQSETPKADAGSDRPSSSGPSADDQGAGDAPAAASGGTSRRRNGDRGRNASSARSSTNDKKDNAMSDDVVSVDEQADMISTFLEGLLGALDAEGTIERTKVDDDTIELAVQGDDLGLLIGPKGQTLTAVHELSRTVLQRRATGRHDGRVRIDIGGYRQRRKEALARFVQTQASDVVDAGVQRALEPMNAADRKVVHDTVNEIDGVSTLSEGVDPNRRVVLVPEGADA